MERKAGIRYMVFLLFLAGSFLVYAENSSFEYGFYERLRQEYIKNVSDLENNSSTNINYFRFKTSLWGKYNFSEELYLYSKLTGECRAYAYPSTKFDINEYVLENFYIDVKGFSDLPLSLRIGRQNLIYGEGFLILEGTPLDGSRTIYFNAIKASLDFDKSDWDIFFIRQDPKDRRLPMVNDSNKSLVEYKEEAVGVYGKHSYWEDFCMDSYYVYKEERSSPKTKLHTVGGRAVYTFDPFKVRSEVATQYGEYGDNSRKGLGGYLFFDYNLKDVVFTPTLTMGGLYLSGDDPATSTDESWNPLFSRYTYLSTVYAYILKMEKAIYYWTNTQMYRLGITLKPTDKLKITANCNYFRANENTYRANSTDFSFSEKDKGINPQLLFTYTFNKNISGHLLFDFFHPKGYYRETKDDALFCRWQIEIKI